MVSGMGLWVVMPKKVKKYQIHCTIVGMSYPSPHSLRGICFVDFELIEP